MKRLITMLAMLLFICVFMSAGAAEKLSAVRCEEEDFATMTPEGCPARYTKGTGLQVFAEHEGYIPYVIISRRTADMKLKNPVNYLNNVYREYMENQYGSSMLGMNPAKEWEVGGKKLIGARYLYKVSGKTVCMLRLIEQRDDGDVEYSAKYIDGSGDRTMEVLDAAVKHYETGSREKKPGEPQEDVIVPEDFSGLEVNTESGIYWAALTDTDRIENGGFFTARLYLRDLYPADSVKGLKEGSIVRVNGQDFTVSSVIPHEEETVEICVKEDFDGYIVFYKESDLYCTAVVNDWSPCSHIADQKVMLPLADAFTFTWIEGEDDATVYDADSFVRLLDEVSMTQYNTVLEYRGGLVTSIIHTSYPVGPEGD